MGLIENKEGTNFYPKVVKGTDWQCDWLLSTHRGCPLGCLYCSSKRLNVRFGGDPTEIRRLKGAFSSYYEDVAYLKVIKMSGGIFVNPYCDIMTLPKDDIRQILDVCDFNHYSKRKANFIFQTKDPAKYFDYLDMIPPDSWLGTTIESDFGWFDTTKESWYNESISKAPHPFNRYFRMYQLSQKHKQFKYFVTIKPVMKFDLFSMVGFMKAIKPDLLFIGANTSKVNLPEPTPDELVALIEELRKITVVYLKSNLKRLLPKGYENV